MMMKRIRAPLALLLLLPMMIGCAAAEEAPALVEYDGGYFTLSIPEGWVVSTMGQYSAFSFRAWDPANPAYEIFCYGTIAPLMKSEAARAWNASYSAYVAEGSTYHLFADAPAIDVTDVSTVFYAFPSLNRFAQKYSGTYILPGYSFPTLRGFAPIETVPWQTPLSAACATEGIVFASLQSDEGVNCYGRFSASIYDAPASVMDGVDLSPAGALNVTGVIAPQDDFERVQNMLTQAVFSLRFTQEYIDEANAYSRRTGDAALAGNAERQALFEQYCEAWNAYFRD